MVMIMVTFQVAKNHRINERLTALKPTQKNVEYNREVPSSSGSLVHIEKEDADDYQTSQKKFSRKLGLLEREVAELIDNREEEEANLNDFEAEQAKAKAQIQELLSVMEEALVSDKIDTEWAESAVDSFYNAINDDDWQGIELLIAECGNAVCIAEIVVKPDMMQENIHRLPDLISWNAEIFINVLNNDSGDAVVFISREDHSLPRPM